MKAHKQSTALNQFYTNLLMSKIGKFITQHLKQIMAPYLNKQLQSDRLPTLDRHISSYFKSHKSLGPNQRKQIYEKSYDLIRHQIFLDHLCKGNRDLQLRLKLLHTSDFYTEMENPKLAKWIRCSFPQNLYRKIENSFGEFQAFELCKALNTRAPLTLRINPLKTTRADFAKKLGKFLDTEFKFTEISPYGLILPANRNIPLHQTQQAKEGHFQIQDEASQVVAYQVRCKPGDIVLDFCSGSGGKSLAISHFLEGRGQLFLHDPRQKSLEIAKKRFQRAGINNVQYHKDETSLTKIITRKADWILLDVPCSGTGTIRRNPDIKLRFSEDNLNYHTRLQEQIVSRSLKYLRKSGRLVYSTCSILKEENEVQIQKFTKQFNLQVQESQVMKTKTCKGGMDGMFAAVLRQK